MAQKVVKSKVVGEECSSRSASTSALLRSATVCSFIFIRQGGT
jgi:hypothetical protein